MSTIQPSDSPQTCPRCGAPLTTEPGYITWCDRCNWNVLPQRPTRARSRFEMLYDVLGERFGKALLAEIRQQPARQSKPTAARVLAWLLAGSVHSLTLILSLLGIVFMLNNRGSCYSLVGGVVCMCLAWILRPRTPRLIEGVKVSRREQLPELYRLIDRVAVALSALPLNGVVIDADFNAAYVMVGWRRTRILILGLPLLSILSPQERIAVIAHELAHSVNGDPARGMIVGSALDTLTRWYHLLLPDPMLSHRYGLPGMFANAVLLAFSLLPWAAAQAMIHLLYRDSQRAEYLADRLTVQVSGVTATLSALEKMYLTDTFMLSVRRSALDSSITDFFTEFRQRVKNLPVRESERIRRAEQLHGSRLNMTHPPTAYRIEALTTLPTTTPQVTCDEDTAHQIEQELMSYCAAIDRELKRRYEASLYG